MVDFKFIFDFGSPKTYLVYKLLPGIEKRTNRKAEYVPDLLGGIFNKLVLYFLILGALKYFLDGQSIF